MNFAECKPFSIIESQQLIDIEERMEEYIFRPGEDIISHGDAGDRYYIIKSGSVVVLKKMLKDELEQVEVLGKGDGFGEDALINGTKQTATVRALEHTTVRLVSGNDFNLILKPSFLEEVFPEDVETDVNGDFTFLDVRMEEEFDEEHIPGAINIPVDELRMRLSEFDPGREYYVYCLAGPRSAQASFILKSQGFNAMSIKGGISAWTGPLVEAGEKINESIVPT